MTKGTQPSTPTKDLDRVLSSNTTIHTGERNEYSEGRHHHFNLWSTIGINYSSIGTPLSIGTYLAFIVGVGGSPVFVFGYSVAVTFQIIICFSLAEIAGAHPHSTGQVYWTSILAPPRYSRVLSYWVGAFTSAAWFFWTVGTYLIAAQLLLAAAIMTNPSYVEQQYHVYLCYVAGAVLAVLMNIPLFKYYSMLMRVMMFAINAGALIVFVTLLARASPKRDAWAVFVIVNETGWSSNGFVFLLGCLPGITAVNGFDSSTHVTDEIPDPATQIPKVMVWTSVLAGLSGLPMTIALMFCVVNEENLLAPIGGQPLAQLFVDSLDSKSLSLFLQSIYIIVFYIGCGALTTTFSRVLWSLAAERHIFFHDWVSALKGERQLPENAIYLAVTLSCAMGTLIFASSTVINAILGTAAICFFSSYMIPIACLLYDRKGLGDSKRTMNLGAVGPVLNWLSMAWMLLMSVVLLFPIYLPVTPSTMNYAVVVLAGIVFVYTLNWWLFARKNYRDPKEAKIEDTVASHDA